MLSSESIENSNIGFVSLVFFTSAICTGSDTKICKSTNSEMLSTNRKALEHVKFLQFGNFFGFFFSLILVLEFIPD